MNRGLYFTCLVLCFRVTGNLYFLNFIISGDVAPQAKASLDNRKTKEVSGTNEATTQNHEITSALDTEAAASEDVAISKKTDTQILDIGVSKYPPFFHRK